MADGEVRIEITADESDAEKKLKNVESAANDAADDLSNAGESAEDAAKGLKNAGKGAEEAENGFTAADAAVGDFISDGLQNLIGALGESISSLFALAEETREYREDISKLEAAFITAGHSTDTASTVYKNFYKILGESDQSVEASNHLAEMVKNEEDVAKWSDIAAGTLATFQDSLPLESLTESAKQTAELGKLTGPLVDSIERAGIGEENFNKQLAACNTEQERAALITETLHKHYAKAGEEYNKLTASTQNARLATANMEQAQAKLGASIEPLTAAWTNLKANALEAITPVIQSVVTSFQNLSKWMDENPGKAEIIKGVLLGIAAALGVIAVALGISSLISMVTTAFSVLGSVLAVAFSPVTLIVAAIAGLVAAFLYLWNNCEAFRNFFIGIWEAIKPPIMEFISYLQSLFQQAWEYIKGVWDTVQPYFAAIWEAIKAIFSVVASVLGAYYKAAWEAIKIIWDVAVTYFKFVWEGIKEVFSVVKVYLSGMFQTAWEAIKAIWNAVTGYFKAIWETIKGIFAVVKAVLSGNWSEAWEAIKGIVNTWKAYFSGVWESIKSVFASVKTWFSSTFSAAWTSIKNIFSNAVSTFSEIGSNIVAGIKQGISSAWNNLVSWFSGLFGDLKSIAKKILGINSPSKEFAWMGEMTVDGYSEGIIKNKKSALSAVEKFGNDILASIRTTVAFENGRAATASPGSSDNGFNDLARAVGVQTAGINSLAGEYRRGSSNMRPVILELNGREVGRTVVDVGGTEEKRIGAKISVVGGAHK